MRNILIISLLLFAICVDAQTTNRVSLKRGIQKCLDLLGDPIENCFVTTDANGEAMYIDSATMAALVLPDHGTLTGLTDDDHAQYALLSGRSSGQTLIGGTTTTADLILQTTSGVGATGAEMQFKVGNNGATQAMTILNSGRVGIGSTVTAPISPLHFAGGAERAIFEVDVGGTRSPLNLWNKNTGDAAGVGFLLSSGGNGLTTGFIGGLISKKTDATNSNTYVRVLSNNVLSTETPTTAPFFIQGGAARTTVIMNAADTRLGINVLSPNAKLDIIGTTEQTRFGYDASNYFSTTVNSTGSTTLDLIGTNPVFTFSDDVNIPDEAYAVGWDASTEATTKNSVYDKIETLAPINNASFTGTVRIPRYTVATLPAGSQGETAIVTDATAPTYLGALTGGGAVVTPVFHDGTIWRSY